MLTYDERLALLRKKKIEHTLEKKEQQGYMDEDDYGSIPLPDNYHPVIIPNSPDGGIYGQEGMSKNFVSLLAAHPPYVDPLEMLCCRWRDKLDNYRVNKRWDEARFPYDELKPYQAMYNITSGIDNYQHLAADFQIGLSLGFGGLLLKIQKYRRIQPDKKSFYDAEERCLLAIIDFVQRHIKRIQELIAVEQRPEIKQNLEQMLETNTAILFDAPKTFREACQWVAYFNCMTRIYNRDGAGFQLDVVLKPYYERDIKDGSLDDETAVFLLANLLLIDSHYYQISGVDAEDNDLTNHLSYLVLEAADKINISANITVRCHENCDRNFLSKAVYYLLKNKNAWPRFCSDRNLTEGYMRNGYSKETARQRIAVGCNWMCIPGKEFPMNDTVKINIAKVMEQALISMKDKPQKSMEGLFALYEEHLTKAIEITAAGINLHINHQAEVTPELIVNLMMENTLELGLDISQCAQMYTIGVDGAGLAIVADSFAALEQRVEKEKLLTWDEMYAQLESNFEGENGQRVRAMLQAAPRYCQGGTIADEWAKRLTESYVRLIKAQAMPDKRQLVPGWFSWSRTIEYGSKVGATPNGRKAGEPISHGANPNPHFRKDGAATAQASGIASVQCGYGNTAPLQIEFDPMVSVENGGVEKIVQFIETHFKQGGTLININILDGDKLMAAHKNPSLYPDLVVRVTGFTAYFAVLSPQFRQLVVDRFLKGI